MRLWKLKSDGVIYIVILISKNVLLVLKQRNLKNIEIIDAISGD